MTGRITGRNTGRNTEVNTRRNTKRNTGGIKKGKGIQEEDLGKIKLTCGFVRSR
jgi:hypothetical protein